MYIKGHYQESEKKLQNGRKTLQIIYLLKGLLIRIYKLLQVNDEERIRYKNGQRIRKDIFPKKIWKITSIGKDMEKLETLFMLVVMQNVIYSKLLKTSTCTGMFMGAFRAKRWK